MSNQSCDTRINEFISLMASTLMSKVAICSKLYSMANIQKRYDGIKELVWAIFVRKRTVLQQSSHLIIKTTEHDS